MKKTFLSLFMVLLTCGLYATTVTKTVATIGSEQNWTAKSSYLTFAFDEVITFTTFGTNGYFSADDPVDWRLYQAREKGKFVISAKKGYVIESINLTYGTKNTTDIIARNSALNVAANNQIVSGTTCAINATSVTLFVSSTGTGTNGQAKISSITVTYSAFNAVEETFSTVDQSGAAAANTTWQGDYANWTVTGARRAASDTLAWGIQGTWTSNNGTTPTVLTTTNAEGGVKHISFWWRQWGSETGATLKMNVKVGEAFDQTSQTTGVDAALAPFVLFDAEVGCKQNKQIELTNTSVKNTKSGRIAFRDLIITPYLLYTTKEATLNLTEATTYKNTGLIDNRDDATAITYSILEGDATIADDGTVTPNAAGTVKVQAKWGDVTTTYTLTVQAPSNTTVVFHKNDGVEPETTLNMTAIYGQPMPATDASNWTRTGYTLNNFWLTADAQNATRITTNNVKWVQNRANYTDASTNPLWIYEGEGPVNVYANWKLETYTITYANMDGATNFADAPATYTIETPTITLGSPTKTGYDFAGWKVTDAEDADISEIALGSTGNLKLYATWTAHKTLVHFMANGGDEKATFDKQIAYGSNAAILLKADVEAKLTREGYAFANYYTTENAAEGTCMTIVVSSGNLRWVNGPLTDCVDADNKWIKDGGEMTLYANWASQTTEVIFHMNDGAAEETTYSITATYGQGMPEGNEALAWTRTGYALDNFWLTADATDKTRITTNNETWVSSRSGYTNAANQWIYTGASPVHVYAKWNINKTIVHFVANGGDETATFDAEVEYGTRVAILSATDVTNKLTRTGYTFYNYWTTEDGGLRMTNVVNSGKLYFLGGAREGYLDASGNWIKDGGEATFYAHWTPTAAPALELADNVDNATTLSDNNGETRSVTIKRSFSNAYYNTICLPFAVTAEQIASVFGAGTVVKTLSNASLSGDMLSLSFSAVEAMEAGKPYLIQPANSVANPVFSNVAINNAVNNTVTTDVDFVGIFSPIALTANNHNTLFLVANNELGFPEETANINGFRGYFNVRGASQSAVRARIVMQPDAATDIDAIENVNENVKQMVNGQVMIVRGGHRYTVLGVRVE